MFLLSFSLPSLGRETVSHHGHGSGKPECVMLERSDSPAFPPWKLGPAVGVQRAGGHAHLPSVLPPHAPRPRLWSSPTRRIDGLERQWCEGKPELAHRSVKPPSRGRVISMLLSVHERPPHAGAPSPPPRNCGRSGGRGGDSGLQSASRWPACPSVWPTCGVSTGHSTHLWLPQSVCVRVCV